FSAGERGPLFAAGRDCARPVRIALPWPPNFTPPQASSKAMARTSRHEGTHLAKPTSPSRRVPSRHAGVRRRSKTMQVATPAASRLAWVDVANGVCIVLVVLMHATLGVEKATGENTWLHA